jgi:flagellar M-ring protein FliF
MDALKRFTVLPASQMASIVIAIVAVVGFLIGAWTWLQTPDYRALYSNLGDKDGGAVIAALSTMNVPYKFNDGGTQILVPANLVPDTRLKLASQGLPKGSAGGFEVLRDQKFGTTQLQEQMNYQNGLEGELIKSIQSINAVQVARVHLAIPKPTIFLREHQKPSASVVVTLYPGRTLDGAQVQGIAHLVSAAVPELSDQDVSIVDGTGNLLSRRAETNGLDPGKLGMIHEVEDHKRQQVIKILEPIVGPGNARVEVTADIDFSQTERTAETFTPNGTPDKTAIRSQLVAESSNINGTPANGGGVPGAQANTPTNAGAAAPGVPASGAGGGTTSNATKKDNTINYELDRTVETKRLPTGTIKRLSAAIVVNNRSVAAKPAEGKAADPKSDAKADAAKVATSVPLKKEEIDQITSLAREAMGFDEKRGDTINVVNTPFTQPDVPPAPEVPMWKDPENISTAKDVGKNVAFALLGAYLLFGVLRPAIRRISSQVPVATTTTQQSVTSEVEATAPPALAYPEHLQRARQLARDDPKAIAGMVRNWVAAE